MLLQRLKEYADTDNERFMPPTLYSKKAVRYIVNLDSGGKYLNVTDTSNQDNPSDRRGRQLMYPNIQRSGSAIRPILFSDNLEYTLGIAKPNSKQDRVSSCHKAYVDLVEMCAVETGLASVAAVLAFLRSGNAAEKVLEDKEVDANANVTFSVNGESVVDNIAVQKFWINAAPVQDAQIMQCVVCGETKSVLKRLQKKIKGIPGGQPSGTALISANSDVFESYGLDNSLIAPTCADCGEKFTESINFLLRDERFHVRFPAAKIIFWTRKPTEFSFGKMLNTPSEDDVRIQIESLWSGERTLDVDDTAFYAVALSASGGRTVVRDWIDTTVGEVKANLKRWFTFQSIVTSYGEPPNRLGIYGLARATVRESRDIPVTMPPALMRSAIIGAPLPWDLLYQAVRRNRAEQQITMPRAALIKLVLLTNSAHSTETKDDYMVSLEMENNEPAYLCGRLLHVLENAQRAAIGRNINATIVDRYFGTASTAPSSVFSRLLKGAQPHLSKLRRDNPRAHSAIQGRITDILEQLPEFPRTLTLREQGVFALGYYHQRAHERAAGRQRQEKVLIAEFEATDETE